MKIVVLDGYTENPGDLSWEGLEQLGQLTVYDRTNGGTNEVIQRIGDAEIVYTNKTPLSDEIFAACPNIRFVGVLATGYNVVDIEAARRHNIIVTNVPSYGTSAVAQFAIGLLLEICHHIGHHNDRVHQGGWQQSPDWCFWDYPLMELEGKTMGIIGFGRIGQTVGRIAKGLGMRVIANDRYETESGRETAVYVDRETLFRESDVISLHCPLFADTEGIINENSIAKMKDGVIILNNSRGALIVEKDLAEALNNGKVYAAGVDVVSTEPICADNPLLKAKNCIITPHISWASRESRERLMDIAVNNLKEFLNGNFVNVVNR